MDEISIKLTPDKYDWAGRINYKMSQFEPEVQKHLYRYVYVDTSEFTFKWVTKDGVLGYDLKYTSLETVPCPKGRFGGNTDITDSLSIVN